MAKILIVDDSETLRSQLKKSLEDAGHTVVEGYDGVREGRRVLRSNGQVGKISGAETRWGCLDIDLLKSKICRWKENTIMGKKIEIMQTWNRNGMSQEKV